MTPDGRSVYVADQDSAIGSGSVWVINTATNSVAATVELSALPLGSQLGPRPRINRHSIHAATSTVARHSRSDRPHQLIALGRDEPAAIDFVIGQVVMIDAGVDANLDLRQRVARRADVDEQNAVLTR